MKQDLPPTGTFAKTRKLSDVSAPRQALVRLFQSIDYGQILDLRVRDQEPIFFNPAPDVIFEVKLEGDCSQRHESELADFALRDEVLRLLDQLDRIGSGCIQKIEVRAGIPRRMLIQATLTEAVR